MAVVFNTIPADDASTQTLLPSKSKTSLRRVVVAAAVASFALGAVFATATQSKVAPSAVAQAAFHSHHHDPCATCSLGGCQCWGPETYGCDQRHCKNAQYVQCDAGGCDQSGAIASCTKANWPSADDWAVACLLNNAGVSCKGGNCIQTGATATGATKGVTCEGGGCTGTPPKPAPAPPKPTPKPPAPPAPKPPAPKPPAPKPAPAKPTSLFAKPATPLKTKVCSGSDQILCIFNDPGAANGVNSFCGTTAACEASPGNINMGQPGKHAPVGHPAASDLCTKSNANEQACKSAPGDCTWLTGLPAGSDTCVYFPPGQKPAAAKPAPKSCPDNRKSSTTKVVCEAAGCSWVPGSFGGVPGVVAVGGICVPPSSIPAGGIKPIVLP